MRGRSGSGSIIPRNHGHNFPGYGRDPLFSGIREETTNMSLAKSDMSLIMAAKATGHNTNVGRGIWSLHAKVPQKQYEPMVYSKDIYPRNPVTMMPEHKNAPKYFDGRFLKYDYKDMIPATKPGSSDDAQRPVVFKPDHIENVQTKKKYVTLKGKTSVPLHLINDVNSELFQRSLNVGKQPNYPESTGPYLNTKPNPTPRDRDHIKSGLVQTSKSSDIAAGWLADDAYSDFGTEWSSKSSKVFTVKDDKAVFKDSGVRSGKFYEEPDWLRSELLRDKIANTMKFMGAASYHKTPRRRGYDINFGH